MLAEVSSADLSTLYVLLAFLAFAVAIYLAYTGQWIGAVVAAFVGVAIVTVA